MSSSAALFRARRARAFSFGSREAARAAIVIATLVTSVVVARSTLANAMRETHPVSASALAPGNARVALAGGLALLGGGARPDDQAVRSRVRSALDRDTTIPAALELEALDRQRRGDLAGAGRLYGLSNRISRRSLGTRLWLVQSAVERGDAARALAEMDLALRTSSAAPDMVFPALANGLEDPALVAPVARLVDRPSDWRTPFLTYAMNNADPGGAATLLIKLKDRRGINAAAFDLLLVRLVDGGEFANARALARRFGRARGGATLVADERFADERAHYPFGWALTEGEALGARRDIQRGIPVLDYHANSAEGGQVAAQVLMMSPGSYRLATRVGRAASALQPLWVLACAGASKPLATLELPARDLGVSARSVRIPADCPAQWLVLIVRPALNTQSGSVARVELRRTGPA